MLPLLPAPFVMQQFPDLLAHNETSSINGSAGASERPAGETKFNIQGLWRESWGHLLTSLCRIVEFAIFS